MKFLIVITKKIEKTIKKEIKKNNNKKYDQSIGFLYF